MNEQQLQTHVPIMGWLLIAHSLLQMVLGLFAFALIMSGSVFWSELGQMDPWSMTLRGVRIFAMFNHPHRAYGDVDRRVGVRASHSSIGRRDWFTGTQVVGASPRDHCVRICVA